MTNFEKIKSMSIEEMAEFLQNIEKCDDRASREPIISIFYIGEEDGICVKNDFTYINEWLEREVE